jgi:hypothetical protein
MTVHVLEGGRATRSIAKRYIERGWVAIPVELKAKKPKHPAWQTVTLEQARDSFDTDFPQGRTTNIGVLLGGASNHLVDVDLDDPIAVQLAPRFLPATATFGRISNPGSHWLYHCETATAKFQAVNMVAEIRASGCQTVFPGSIHSSGEAIEWENEGQPLAILSDDLVRAVTDLCVCAAFIGVWPAANTGGRHEASMGLAGVLRNARIDRERARAILDALCDHVQDPEKRDRMRALEDTYETDTVKAWSCFVDINPKVKRAVNGWLRQINDVSGDNAVLVPIHLSDEELYETVINELVKAKRVYRTGNILTEIIGSKTHHLTPDTIRMRISPPIVFVKEGKDGEPVRATPPGWLLKAIVNKPAPDRVPEVVAVTDIPTIRPDGSIVSLPGHDPETRVFYIPGKPIPIPQVDTDTAVRNILLPFADFPWAQPDTDVAAFLAAVLTVIIRGTYEGRPPALLIDKNAAGAGATLLAQCLGMMATGDDLPVHLPDTNEETNKRIHVAVLQGDPVIFLDNRRELGGPFIDALLTSRKINIRILGQSKSSVVDFRSLVIATGNNLQINGDLARRVYRIRLDSPHEKPYLAGGYRIKDLLGYVRSNRAAIVGNTLRLAQLWFEAGAPHHGQKELGGFEGWSRVVRGIVSFTGLGDPMCSTEGMDDTTTDSWTQFVAATPKGKFTCRELYELTQMGVGQKTPEQNDLLAALEAVMYPILPHQFTAVNIGIKIAEFRDKHTNEGVIRRKKDRNGVSVFWKEDKP